jgi:hypothetical protein
LPTYSRASCGRPGGLGGKAHPEPPLSSLAFGNASRIFHYHTARVASFALYYQCRDCAALPSRPLGSPQGETLIPDPRPLTPATFMVRLCNLAEPIGPAQVSRAYLYMVSPGRGVFQQSTNDSRRALVRPESFVVSLIALASSASHLALPVVLFSLSLDRSHRPLGGARGLCYEFLGRRAPPT